jgi:hypothetical protein
MKSVVSRIKPRAGFSHFIHIALVTLLPVLAYVFVATDLEWGALALVLLSKWRMLAVRPRHWPANIRANAVDLIVGLSLLVFMTQSQSMSFQLLWMVVYAGWLLWLKPRSDLLGVSTQAMVAQLFGLMAIFLNWSDASLLVLVVLAWAVCYSSARHFFVSFEEPYTSLFSHVWGYFAAALVWLQGHWLLFYGVVAQPALLLTVIGYGLASLYYLDQKDRLSVLVRRQFIFIMIAIVTVVLAVSNIGNDSLVR